jgi:hypothetical protein
MRKWWWITGFEAVQRLVKGEEAWLEDVPGSRSKFGWRQVTSKTQDRTSSLHFVAVFRKPRAKYSTSLDQPDHMMSNSGMRTRGAAAA